MVVLFYSRFEFVHALITYASFGKHHTANYLKAHSLHSKRAEPMGNQTDDEVMCSAAVEVTRQSR